MARRYAVGVIGLVFAIALVAVVGVWSYASNVEPLVFGSAWGLAGAERSETGGEPLYRFPFVEQGEARWGVEVVNPLPVTVTIRGPHPRFPAGASLVTEPELLLRTDSTIGVEPQRTRPFTPVELAPGERVFLVFAQRFVDRGTACTKWEPGTALGFEDVWVDVTLGPVTRLAKVDLPFAVGFEAPGSDDC